MASSLYCLSAQPVIELNQEFPRIQVHTWWHHSLELFAPGTHVGFVYQGQPHLHRAAQNDDYRLQPGMYFSLPGSGHIDGAASAGMVITLLRYQGMFMVGGPLESCGRLAYINGGTSSLLIPPICRGDPCLHGMYLPGGIEQTLHTHPSYRVGLVVTGGGSLTTPQQHLPLQPGTLFVIPAHDQHRFCTDDTGLIVVVLHPDSPTGFTHQENPMMTRTLVDGRSATELPQLHTSIE
ncbi:hypothetical protein XM38_015200 [Halomicronema hongdechloris C2206]|uniref:Cupin type-2 domain-containing protein n=1 Tax=Halomicronema hongdechloris C2206 TaxID=1641165 RepID=A0A1Z3HJV1_9CYAN|nr:cupin domain-containing protein [Halomicronema hongdechloris]ASC70580.1 hypothetical protein XM38_015200 [Halomicronema hongdechloris C2206]